MLSVHRHDGARLSHGCRCHRGRRTARSTTAECRSSEGVRRHLRKPRGMGCVAVSSPIPAMHHRRARTAGLPVPASRTVSIGTVRSARPHVYGAGGAHDVLEVQPGMSVQTGGRVGRRARAGDPLSRRWPPLHEAG
jgi:hypothetical protein